MINLCWRNEIPVPPGGGSLDPPPLYFGSLKVKYNMLYILKSSWAPWKESAKKVAHLQKHG